MGGLQNEGRLFFTMREGLVLAGNTRTQLSQVIAASWLRTASSRPTRSYTDFLYKILLKDETVMAYNSCNKYIKYSSP